MRLRRWIRRNSGAHYAARPLVTSEEALDAAVVGVPMYWRDAAGRTWKIERMPDLPAPRMPLMSGEER